MQHVYSSTLPDILKISNYFLKSDYDSVRVESQKLINTAFQNKHDKDYSLLLHIAYTYIGLVAIFSNSMAEGKKLLIDSITLPKNGPVFSFGPNMLLCRYIIIVNSDFDSVRHFLQIAKTKTSIMYKFRYLNRFLKSINNRKMPNFDTHLYYHLFPDTSIISEVKAKIVDLDESLGLRNN